MKPFISICIPAYKRTDFIRRLLDSIEAQTFRDFEVIVTDDSPTHEVQELCAGYDQVLPLRYFKNPQQLGTPENWNEAIRKSSGEWIKLMHDDDWFGYPDSLQKLVDLTKAPEKCSFVFCGSTILENNVIVRSENMSRFRERLLVKDPQNLFFRNFIGPPSVTMHRNDRAVWYDTRMKWLVDVDFYIRYLQHAGCFHCTRAFLVNVGFSDGQVTRQVIGDPRVVIPENLLLLSKLAPLVILRLWNYDFAWRLMRNYDIRSKEQLTSLALLTENVPVPRSLIFIVKWQRFIPRGMLHLGLFSKCVMFLSFIVLRTARIFR